MKTLEGMNTREGLNTHQGINPLLPLVLRVLRGTPEGISEHELLKKIEASGDYFSALADDDDAQLALFQKHFLVMNALYQLQDELWRDEKLWLFISPLRIALSTMNSDAAGQAVAAHGDDALRAYYLDWRQFAATDSAAVTRLLESFWTLYAARDRRGEALAALQLGDDADWDAIKRQYRRLAAQTHPDRGGDAAQFLAIRAAYETLSLVHR